MWKFASNKRGLIMSLPKVVQVHCKLGQSLASWWGSNLGLAVLSSIGRDFAPSTNIVNSSDKISLHLKGSRSLQAQQDMQASEG
jgi:hypothetical protein